MKSRKTQKKPASQKNPRLGKLIIALLLIGAITYISFSLTDIYRRRYTIEKEKQQFSEEIAQIRFQNTELSRLQSYISSELYKDRELKKKLDYQNPEETAVVVDIPEEAIPENSESFPRDVNASLSSQLPKAETLPEKWWAFFFSKNRL